MNKRFLIEVTGIAFGTKDMNVLFATTAAEGKKIKAPPTGGLYRITGIHGKGLIQSTYNMLGK